LALWKKLWVLFTVIWVIVAGLNAMTIIVFAEGVEREKAWLPITFAVLVPALLFGIGWVWELLRRHRRRGSE
jgi:hypothetical protein